MGGAESVVRNVDKRKSRREHRASFESAVARFRSAPFEAPAQQRGSTCQASGLRVCIRKRPFFPHEAQQGEFDVLSCLPERIVVHDARMHPDMVKMFMNHHDFRFDEVFSEMVDNEAVYQNTAGGLVDSVTSGSQATIMMYGQTGSGKTYTMTALHQRVAEDLFKCLGQNSAPESTPQPPSVSMYFIELLGDSCFDMLNGGAPCSLASAVDGSVHPHPSVEVAVESASELLALIRMASKLRATAATGVHDQSSRSHAICRIFIRGGSGGNDEEGCLTLVDLAGTEHRIDNAEHNAERSKEGAKINASLAALKECIRASAAGSKFVAFRQNRLTQLLRGCFVHTRPHPTIVIATVSPSSKDTEHSLNTLRHACIMDGQGEGKGKNSSSHLTGGVVRKEMLGEIDVTAIARARAAKRSSRGTQQADPAEMRSPPAHQSKQSNTCRRAGLDRRCVESLPPEVAKRLLAAREAAVARGTDRQRMRLQGRDAIDSSVIPDECDWGNRQAPSSPIQDLNNSSNTLDELSESQTDHHWESSKVQDSTNKCKLTDPSLHLPGTTQESTSTRQALDDLLGCPPHQQQDISGSPSRLGQTAHVEVDMADFSCPAGDSFDVSQDVPDCRSSATRCMTGLPSDKAAPDESEHSRRTRPWQRRLSRSGTDEADAVPTDAAGKAGAALVTTMTEPSVARLSDSKLETAMHSENEKALALFRLFCDEGRGAQTWRKNDLRLINTCVLPAVFGPGVQIDWAHPNAALDELDKLVAHLGYPVADHLPSHPRNPLQVNEKQASAAQHVRPRHATPQTQHITNRTGASSMKSRQSPAPQRHEIQSELTSSPGMRSRQSPLAQRQSRNTNLQSSTDSGGGRDRSTAKSLRTSWSAGCQPQTDCSSTQEDQHDRPRRRSTDNITNLEKQVANAEADARRWLAELRGEVTCP